MSDPQSRFSEDTTSSGGDSHNQLPRYEPQSPMYENPRPPPQPPPPGYGRAGYEQPSYGQNTDRQDTGYGQPEQQAPQTNTPSLLSHIFQPKAKVTTENGLAEWPVSQEEEEHMDKQKETLTNSRQSERSIRTDSSKKSSLSDKVKNLIPGKKKKKKN